MKHIQKLHCWQKWSFENFSYEKRRIFDGETPDSSKPSAQFEAKVEEGSDAKIKEQLEKIKIGDKTIDLTDKNKKINTANYSLAIQKIDMAAMTTISGVFKEAYPGRLQNNTLPPAEQQRAVQVMEGIRASAPAPHIEKDGITPENITGYFNAYLNIFQKFNFADVNKEADGNNMLQKVKNIKSIPSEVQTWIDAQGKDKYVINTSNGTILYTNPFDEVLTFEFKTGIKDIKPIFGKEGKVDGFIVLDGDGDISVFNTEGASYIETSALESARKNKNSNSLITEGRNAVYRYTNTGKTVEFVGTEASAQATGEFSGKNISTRDDGSVENTEKIFKERKTVKEEARKKAEEKEKASKEDIKNLLDFIKTPDAKDIKKVLGKGSEITDLSKAKEAGQIKLGEVLQDPKNYKNFPSGTFNIKAIVPLEFRKGLFLKLINSYNIPYKKPPEGTEKEMDTITLKDARLEFGLGGKNTMSFAEDNIKINFPDYSKTMPQEMNNRVAQFIVNGLKLGNVELPTNYVIKSMKGEITRGKAIGIEIVIGADGQSDATHALTFMEEGVKIGEDSTVHKYGDDKALAEIQKWFEKKEEKTEEAPKPKP
ncbi:hypothetical protein HZA38_03730 [Candidatus Peregrinibacteria bacterium]|nr:hypothetical protein [Candidatus Peregrinibacteria bacterium]